MFRRERPGGGRSSCWPRRLPDTPPVWAPTLAASGRARGGRRAARRFLRGNRPALPSGRRDGAWREIAAVTDTITAVLPAVAGGEVKCQGGKARGFDCKDASLVAFMPNGSHRCEAWHAPQRPLGLDRFGHRPRVRARGADRRHLVRRGDRSRQPEVPGRPPASPGRPAQHLARDQGLPTHAFIVADGAGPHGMQIFDLTQLRSVSSPQTFRETAHYAGINSAHNIVINPPAASPSGRGEHGGRDLRRLAAYSGRSSAAQSEVRRLLRGPSARSSANRLHPRRPMRDLSRAGRRLPWPRDLPDRLRDRPRRRRCHGQGAAQGRSARHLSQRVLRAPGLAHRRPPLLLPRRRRGRADRNRAEDPHGRLRPRPIWRTPSSPPSSTAQRRLPITTSTSTAGTCISPTTWPVCGSWT